MIPCPFKVGDRVHELVGHCSYSRFYIDEEGRFVALEDSKLHFELDTSKPDATVTAITETGFAYLYDYPIPIGPARWGTETESGECYPEGYRYWRKLDPESPPDSP